MTDDVIVLQATAATLGAKLAAVANERHALLARRSREARNRMALCAIATLAILVLARMAYRFVANSEEDDGAIVVGVVVAAGTLFPLGRIAHDLPAFQGVDPMGPWLAATRRWLEQLRPDLHPRARVSLELDGRAIDATPSYREAKSPNSGAQKVYRRLVRVRLKAVLADGSKLAFEAAEKAKHKGGTQIRVEGQARGRLERPADAALGPPPGWQSLVRPREGRRELAFWRKTPAFDATLPEIADLLRLPPGQA